MVHKILFLFMVFIFMPIGKVFALYDYHSLLIDFEEPVRTQGAGLFEAKTKDALLSYSVVEERADYFTFKLKNLTFGEYSDQILYVAPLITGRVEFSIHRVSFTYDFVENKTKIKYKIMF